jgi:uncharacterized protein YndB with AHSA1/START domain
MVGDRSTLMETDMIELRYRAHAAAGPTTVWAVLTDHARMSRWTSRVWRSRLVERGVEDPNGVGAVRSLIGLGGPIREQVVRSEPPSRLEYRMTAGNPLAEELRGTVILHEPDGGGTEIDWTITIVPRPRWLAPVIERAATLSTDRLAVELARAAERHDAGANRAS